MVILLLWCTVLHVFTMDVLKGYIPYWQCEVPPSGGAVLGKGGGGGDGVIKTFLGIFMDTCTESI